MYRRPGLDSETRARELLFAHLSSSQRRDFIQKNYFTCKGNATGRTYRIYNPIRQHPLEDLNFALYFRNIHLTILGLKVGSFCSQPHYDHRVPEGDRLLTQKLAIEANEQYFLKNASYSLEDEAAVTIIVGILGGAALAIGLALRLF
jgi:hypothetical protein